MRAHVVRVGPQGHAIELFVSEPQAMVAVADEVEVLTLDNLAALEVRKPQVPAEVIARSQGALIGWQNADEFDAEELQEHGDALRDATRALLAAVEAVPEGEQRPVEDMTEQECLAELEAAGEEGQACLVLAVATRALLAAVEAAPEDMTEQECLAELEAAGEEGQACLDCQCETQSPFTGYTLELARAAVRDLRKGHGQAAPCEATSTCGRLSADFEVSGTEYPSAPDAKHRFAEWCGENFAAIWYEFSLLRDALGLPQPECDEEASSSDPDFASMSADDLSLEEVQALRDWLDERGRLYEGRATGEEVPFHAWFGGGGAVGAARGSTREAALLALCQKVAAEEASC